MIISRNLNAMFTNRELNIRTKNKTKSIEKLSSGNYINRASDNAAGLSISEKMRSLIRGLNKGASNIQDGISLCQIADGALAQVQSIIHRLEELTVQAANDTNTSEDRNAVQDEISELVDEINSIGESTQFNTINILDGSCAKINKTVTGINPTITIAGIPAIDITTSNKDYLPYNPPEMTTFADNTGLWFGYQRSAGIDIQYDKMTWSELGIEGWGDTTSEDVYNCTYRDSRSGFTMNFAVAKAANTGDIINSLNNVKVNVEYDIPLAVEVSGTSSFVKYINVQSNIKEISLYSYLKYSFDKTSGTIATGRMENAYTSKGSLLLKEPYQSPFIPFKSHKGTTGIISEVNTAVEDYILHGGSSDLTGSWNFFDDYGSTISFDYIIDISQFETYKNDGMLPDDTMMLNFNNNVVRDLTDGQSFILNAMGQPIINYSLNISSPDVTYSYQRGQGVWIQAGANGADGFLIGIEKMDAAVLGIDKLNMINKPDASLAIDKVQNALNIVSSSRSNIGAMQNRLEYMLNNNRSMEFNLQAAESRIRDADMAKEILQLVKENILEQVSQAMSAQANQDFKAILKLFE